MQKVGIENTYAWLYYQPLLVRYARRIIGDHEAAVLLVQKVLADQYQLDGLIESAQLHDLLKADTLLRCSYHTQMRVFDHSINKLPFK